MKTIRYIRNGFYGVLFGLIFTTPVLAQNETGTTGGKSSESSASTVEMRAKTLTDLMACDLKLTDEQAKQVYDINLKAAKDMDAAYERNRGNALQMEKDGAEINKNVNLQLQEVLKPSQWSRYERFRKDSAERREKRESRCTK